MPLPWSCKFPLSIIPISFCLKKVASETFENVILQCMYNFQSFLFPFFHIKFQVSSLILAYLRKNPSKKAQANFNGKKTEYKIITCCCVKYFESSRFVFISLLGNWWLFLRKLTYLPTLRANHICQWIKMLKRLLACTALVLASHSNFIRKLVFH